MGFGVQGSQGLVIVVPEVRCAGALSVVQDGRDELKSGCLQASLALLLSLIVAPHHRGHIPFPNPGVLGLASVSQLCKLRCPSRGNSADDGKSRLPRNTVSHQAWQNLCRILEAKIKSNPIFLARLQEKGHQLLP